MFTPNLNAYYAYSTPIRVYSAVICRKQTYTKHREHAASDKKSDGRYRAFIFIRHEKNVRVIVGVYGHVVGIFWGKALSAVS